jgi:SRSO17 transposase
MYPQDVQNISRKLSDFVDRFQFSLGRAERRHWCKMYLSGLLLNGERKSIEPMANRIEGGSVQNMQQFVNQSSWSYQSLMNDLWLFTTSELKLNQGTLVLDDVSLPKQGRHSVGVAHQYCGALRKVANCRSVVSWQLVGKDLHIPLMAQLYLPEEWTEDIERMNRVGVPENHHKFKKKSQIALDLLDQIDRSELTFQAATFDSSYGFNRKFLKDLDIRQIPFVGQTWEDTYFWSGDAPIDTQPAHTSGLGRKRIHHHIADPQCKPKAAKQWAEEWFANEHNIQAVNLPLKKGGKATFVAKRVYETQRSPYPARCVGPARWLLIERLEDNSLKYYVSNFSEEASPSEMIRIGRERWKIEQGYQ